MANNKCPTRSEEWKRKISQSCKGINSGTNHHLWKGDNVGYRTLHRWVTNHLPKPKVCEMCEKKPPYDLANITGVYSRDFNNWNYLCRSCHMKSDGRIYNLRNQGKI